MRTFVSAKLHGLTVTAKSVEYHGSVSIDGNLLTDAGIALYEQVHVINLTNGQRWVTYALAAEQGAFTLNGGGARLGEIGDRCVVLAYRQAEHFEGATCIFADESNRLIGRLSYG